MATVSASAGASAMPNQPTRLEIGGAVLTIDAIPAKHQRNVPRPSATHCLSDFISDLTPKRGTTTGTPKGQQPIPERGEPAYSLTVRSRNFATPSRSWLGGGE